MRKPVIIAAAALSLAACAHLEPSFEQNRPRVGRVSGCPVSLDEIALRTSGESTSVTEPSRYSADPDFGFRSTALADAADAPVDAASLGGIRTGDIALESDEYSALLCTFTSAAADPSCARRSERTANLLRAALRSEAYTLQADLVHDVRCFGRNDRAGLRVWCEGVAYLTESAEDRCESVVASR